MIVTGGIVTYNNARTIEKCLETVLDITHDKDYEFKLYVLDNGSTDKTMEIVKRFPEVTLIKSEKNVGFGLGHNAIIKRVKSDIHFVINPDIFIDVDVIGGLAKYLTENTSVGLATPKILNFDGTEQFLPKFCPSIRYVFVSKLPGFHYLRERYTRQAEKFEEPTEIKFCTGCFFGARTAYLKELRGFSNRYFMYCEDADLSMRVLEDGKTIMFHPDYTAYHNWQRDNTRNLKGIQRFVKSLLVFFSKWGWKF